MANKRLSELNEIQSMQNSDSIVVIVGGKEYLITKENFSKVLSILTTVQKNKLSAILLSGDGSKILTDSGIYKSINNMFTQGQVILNDDTKLFEINGYHTHTNTEVLDKFSVEENTLLFDGETLSSYSLPISTENTLGGVKVDGTTITVSEDGTISGSINYVLPTATNTVLGGVKVDGDTIKINDGVISVDVIGNWISGISYPVGYFAVYDDKLYQCNTVNSDTEWDESKWNLIGGRSNAVNITEWASDNNYSVDDLIIYENTVYKCNETHTSATEFDTGKWVGLTGAKGDKGDKGENGFSPTLSYETTATGVAVTMTDVNDTYIFDLSNGTNGIDGKSAYEIAVDNGFEGTEQEWLESLHGEDGVTTVSTNKIDKSCTFSVGSWSDIIPYTQTIEVEGITEDLNPRIDVIISDDINTGKQEENDFSYFTKVVTGNGTLTAYCYETKPSVDLSIMIEVI